MDWFILACGSLGAWLLVAGPVYQAALELREQEIDREKIDSVVSSVAPAARMSPLWWLLPPVAYFKQRQLSTEHRNRIMEALPKEQVEQTLTFMNKARGWLIVSLGAFLIAIKETWELAERLHWPIWVFVVIVVVAFVLCVAHAAYQMYATQKMLGEEPPAARGRPKG
ncbi:MAG TPA: hypothetical protein VGM94_04160 [Galbitalea sp.]